MGPLIEILMLAFIAAMIIFKLISVLGQRSGFEASERQKEGFGGPLDREKEQEMRQGPAEEDLIGPGLRKIYTQLKAIEPRFSLSHFLSGATRAFEMIVQAYAAGTLKEVKSLVSSEVYQDFQQAIDERQQKQESLETIIEKIDSTEITDMRLEGTKLTMTVRFTSEQIHLIRDQQGKILEGTPKQSEQIIDLWTFYRDLTVKDPTWTVIRAD